MVTTDERQVTSNYHSPVEAENDETRSLVTGTDGATMPQFRARIDFDE
jgi:hypothetical protein